MYLKCRFHRVTVAKTKYDPSPRQHRKNKTSCSTEIARSKIAFDNASKSGFAPRFRGTPLAVILNPCRCHMGLGISGRASAKPHGPRPAGGERERPFCNTRLNANKYKESVINSAWLIYKKFTRMRSGWPTLFQPIPIGNWLGMGWLSWHTRLGDREMRADPDS